MFIATVQVFTLAILSDKYTRFANFTKSNYREIERVNDPPAVSRQ